MFIISQPQFGTGHLLAAQNQCYNNHKVRAGQTWSFFRGSVRINVNMRTKDRRKKQVRKPIFQSTILRIIVVVIVLVLPINIMTLILTGRVVRNNRREILAETKNVLEMRGRSFEDMLSRAGRKLTFLSINEPEYVQLAAEETRNRHNDGQLLTIINQDLKNIRMEYPWINVLYFRFPRRGYTIMAGYMPGDQQLYRQELESFTYNADGRGKADNIIISQTGVHISRTNWNQMIFGTIVSLERVLIDLGYTNEDHGKIHFFADQEGLPLTKKGRAYLAKKNLTLEQLQQADRYEVFVYKMDKFALSLVEINDLGGIFDQMTDTASGVLLVIAVLTVILVIPLLIISINRQVSRPLQRLVTGIRHVEQGDLDYRIATGKAGSEFEKINRNFNQMMEQVKNLKIDVYEKELERRQVKLRFLSQQIQPHFILNAMNLIYSYEPDQYDLIQKMVLCLAKYFRYIVKNDQLFVTLQQELDHIDNYFEIQKARFIGLFSTRIECDPGLAKALIPPLLIQNFAENAIKYTLRIGQVIDITIKVSPIDSMEKPARMLIEIDDTGEGIPERVLSDIAAFQKTGQPQKTLGVGIQNTIERIKYLYDNRMSLTIRRGADNRGTHIEMILPIYFDEEQKYADFID